MDSAGRHWKEEVPPEHAYKRRAGAAAPTAEQDKAAGGRNRRWVALDDNRYARASISLRLYRRTRRIRAYLRWSKDGETQERYVCEVAHDWRGANLAEAWRCAWEQGFLVEKPLPENSKASSVAVRANMQANRARDTGPELALRSLLHASGLRYRVDARPIPEIRRRADVVFPRERVAVFVDGCFWHGCPKHSRPAKKNADFWSTKIKGNVERDTETNELLLSAGWTVLRVWEHDDPSTAAENVAIAVAKARLGLVGL
ncbi:very short patch repair endonuclease [Streptomyces sp. NPDC002698]|uniref:very short patch repair endonuclease n=1 Tax=Streptomyces sp. NPDC002698 TaxID=3364660 RepID=UPI003693D639